VPDGKRYFRKFSLRLTTVGVEDHSLVQVDKDATIGTSVRLCDYRPEFQAEVPHSSETVGRKIVEHCLEHFVLGLAPAIYLHDSGSEVVHDLNEMFEAEVKVTTTVGKFKAGGRDFQVHNLRVSPGYQGTHRLHLCAHNRAVVSENLAGKIPNLVGSLRGTDNRPFMYAGYVSGAYLDECVNSERTDFVMPDDDSAVHGPGWSTLLKRAIEEAADFVSPFTTSVKNAKEVRITDYVRSKAPEYRSVVKHRKDLLDPIAPDLPDEKLDVELYKANQIYEAELREESSTILSSLESGPADWETFVQKYAQFLEEWNESGVAKLARHIVHRKATLDFLKASLRVNALGKYELESAIHRLIFPLKKTSDDVHPDQMNLWILDEKLTYHYYLASDIPFDKQDVKLPSKDRADIIIFNGPSAFVSETPPFSSVVLIEFKRPLRDDYTDEENPIAQVYRYAELIKSGKATDRGGRPILIKPDTPFFAYLVCDITPTLTRQAKFFSLGPTPDGLGVFGYNRELGVYVEVMSFEKLVSDAERRNAAHFEQLNLPRN